MLQERIFQTLEKRDDLDQRVIARIGGVNESTISRYLNGYDELNFESVLKIVRFLYADQEKEMMTEYALTQRNQNARYALEFCVMAHLYETSDRLIETLLSSNNPVDREWAKMYHLIRLRKKKIIVHEDLLHQLDEFKPNSLHMQVLKRIIKGYVYFDLNDHHSVSVNMNGIESLIEKIKSKFIKNSFNIRLGLIMNYVSLYRNEIEQARYYNSLVIDQDFFESVKATAYHHLGHTYMFEDYNISKEYLELAIELFSKYDQENHLDIALRTLSFLQSYWKIDREYSLKLDNHQNISNYMYYLIQKGDILVAKEYISQINIESISNWDKAFHHYYIGLVDNDKNSFYHSIKWFRESGDFFHVQLPIQALQSLDENELVLQMLAK